MTPSLSLVIPFYNEEECAKRAIRELVAAFDAAGVSEIEFLLVENGSTDNTSALLRDLAQVDRRLKIIATEKNVGYAGAVLTGLSRADGKWIGFTCGDGEIAPEDVVAVFDIARQAGLDFCKAKRIGRQDGLWRKALSYGYHLLVSLLFSVHVTDINGYPVIMQRQVFARMRIPVTNWVFNVEILLEVRRLGLRMVEVDVKHLKRLGGHSHVSPFTPLIFLWQLVSLRLKQKQK
ncbi:MAG: glycosyltransferase family 2 protein [Candidatus Omnitrophota bacterium]